MSMGGEIERLGSKLQSGYHDAMDELGLLDNLRDNGYGYSKEELSQMPEEKQKEIMSRRIKFERNMEKMKKGLDDLTSPNTVENSLMSPQGGQTGDPGSLRRFRENINSRYLR